MPVDMVHTYIHTYINIWNYFSHHKNMELHFNYQKISIRMSEATESGIWKKYVTLCVMYVHYCVIRLLTMKEIRPSKIILVQIMFMT